MFFSFLPHVMNLIIFINTISGAKTLNLPDRYTVVQTIVLKKESVAITCISTRNLLPYEHFNEVVQTEYNWLKHAMDVINKDEFDKEEWLSWDTYHAFSCKVEAACTSITQLMRLFYEHAASAAMIKHGITVQTQAIQFLNPGQIPVIAFDAPLLNFALAKLV